MKRRRVMLTTIDNPYNPLTDFDSWLRYDNDMGYGTCCYLARIGKFSDELTDDENEEEQERAINEIIKYDPFNLYKKVVKEEMINIDEDNVV